MFNLQRVIVEGCQDGVVTQDLISVSRWDKMPTITTVDQYDGQASIQINATQLGAEYSARASAKIVDDWVAFFTAGATAVQEISFASRTPKRLFDSLRSQTQLISLLVKWGDYVDLSVLTGMSNLRALVLNGASNVESVEPLCELSSLELLHIDSLRRVSDLSAIGALSSVSDLSIGGDWMNPRNAHIRSIAFLKEMPQLRHLVLHTVIVDDQDYSPLLCLPNLQNVRAMATRGMSPTIDELKALLPWSG